MGNKARVTIGTITAIAILFLTLTGAFAPMVGPMGPTGPTGPTGPNGQNGANGTNGTNGTNGIDGTNGQNGVGIAQIQSIQVDSTTIALLISYTNGTTQQIDFTSSIVNVYPTTIVQNNSTTIVYEVFGLTSTVTFNCLFTKYDLTSNTNINVILTVNPTTAATSCTVKPAA